MNKIIESEPGVVWCKPWGEGQGDYVRLNLADFDPDKHEQYDPEAAPKKASKKKDA